MHVRRSSGLAGLWARAVRRTLALFAVLGTFVLNGGASTAAASTVQIRPATQQTTAIQLVQAYLTALVPAGSKFLKVEAALKALPSSATRAQVLAVVAPLGPALASIEALLKCSNPDHVGGTSPKPGNGPRGRFDPQYSGRCPPRCRRRGSTPKGF